MSSSCAVSSTTRCTNTFCANFVGYIVQKRFNLSWSIEGTRCELERCCRQARILLSYVADAYLDGRSEDILLQPVSWL